MTDIAEKIIAQLGPKKQSMPLPDLAAAVKATEAQVEAALDEIRENCGQYMVKRSVRQDTEWFGLILQS